MSPGRSRQRASLGIFGCAADRCFWPPLWPRCTLDRTHDKMAVVVNTNAFDGKWNLYGDPCFCEKSIATVTGTGTENVTVETGNLSCCLCCGCCCQVLFCKGPKTFNLAKATDPAGSEKRWNDPNGVSYLEVKDGELKWYQATPTEHDGWVPKNWKMSR